MDNGLSEDTQVFYRRSVLVENIDRPRVHEWGGKATKLSSKTIHSTFLYKLIKILEYGKIKTHDLWANQAGQSECASFEIQEKEGIRSTCTKTDLFH